MNYESSDKANISFYARRMAYNISISAAISRMGV